MGSESQDNTQRQHDRVMLNLPIQVQVGEGEYQDMKVVDISPSGMQISSESFDVLNRGFDSQQNQADFEIRISAHLAWVENSPSGDFLTGWEFDRGVEPSTQKTENDQEKRKHARLEINLPIEAQVEEGDYQEMEVVDISPSGMQLQVKDIEPIKAGADAQHIRSVFDIRIQARLAWVQTGNKDEFLTGWEFDIDTDEIRIG